MCLMGNMELLSTKCRAIGPHLAVRGNSHIFSQVAAGTWGTFKSYGGDFHSKLESVQRLQDSCLLMRDTPGISTRLVRAIRMLLEMRQETEWPFLVATVILGFLPIFKMSQASSPIDELYSACLWRCQRDVRTPLQMRWGHRAFARVSKGDSHLSSSCEMKGEPSFKPLQGNPAFFRIRTSWCPFHLRLQTQGPSHIRIAEGSHLLSCF